MESMACSPPSSESDLPLEQQQQHPHDSKRQRRKALVFSGICTALVLSLVLIVVVEQRAPDSALAALLRRSPCTSTTAARLSVPPARNDAAKVQTKRRRRRRRRRRLEDQQGDENDEDGEEEDESEESEDESADSEEEEEGDNDEEQNQQYDDDYHKWDDDEFQDDQPEIETQAPVYIDDDFYAMPEDPGPPRLFPLTSRDVAAYVLASMGLTLGASGGIGGGGIVVPVYILVAGLTPKMAIPLGAVTVLGGSVASTFVNSRRRHPLADRPIIDWDLVLVTEPLTLIGALTGTLLHRILSEKFLIVILVLLLSVSAHSTLAKAKRMYDAESRYIQKLKAVHLAEAQHHHVHVPVSPPGPRIVPLPTVAKPRQNRNQRASDVYFAPKTTSFGGVVIPPGARTEDDGFSSMTCENQNNDNTTIDNDTSFDDEIDDLRIQKTRSEGSTPRQMGVEERQQILILNPDFITLRSGLLEEEKFTPRSKIIALCLMFSILMFLNIMIGGGAFPSPWGIRCGSVAFWVVQVIMVAFLVASAWAAQTYLVNRHEMKEIVRFDYVHGDIKWDARSAIIYPALFICAGTFAGMFGIGGGMITVPLMLAMGVHPAVVSATSSAMILFTSFASASSYLVFGLILYDYAIVCFVVGFFASLFGNKVMRQARQAKSANGRNFERNSYIAFCIGGVILVSALLMTIDYVFRVYAFDDMDYPEGLCEGYRI